MSRNASLLSCLIFLASFNLVIASGVAEEVSRPPLTGLNMAGGEFGRLGGHFGQDYIYPSEEELADVVRRRFSVIRLPFLWERLQPKLDGPLEEGELARLKSVVTSASALGLSTILDPHNYARYFDQPIGSHEVPVEAFTRFWRLLAEKFRDDPHVIFGLMNEPHDVETQDWAAAATAAIAAIRAADATNLILVPGNAYSGAHSWSKSSYGTPNAVAMGAVSDPCNNMVFELHQYLDAGSSGTSPACPSSEAGVNALRNVTDWLNRHGAKGFLGEFGASERPECVAALNAMLQFMAEHGEAWLGWTYWAGGRWWRPDYMFSIAPRAGVDRPQMIVLETWLGKGGLPPHTCGDAQHSR